MNKTILIVIVSASILGVASVSPADDGIWTTRSPLGLARVMLSSSVVDGKIYVIGGDAGSGGLGLVEEYDPVMDTWSRKANMPTGRAGVASSVVNGKIYVVGGKVTLFGAHLSTVEEYNPATDTWKAKANMPTSRAWVSSSEVNGKIYVIGGTQNYQGTPLSIVEEYDPATDTWTTKADMPTARVNPSTSALNGKIYAIGGAPGGSQWYTGYSIVEEYDPATDTWTRKTDMPIGRTYLSTSVVNGKIYVIGGVTAGNNSQLSSVEEYDPLTDTWTRMADMPTARSAFSTSAVNGKIYAIGGSVGGGGIAAVSTVEEYDLYPLIVDFNGDGIVDSVDVSLMIDNWGMDALLYDIGPMPWGDGIVDVQDLIVLAGHLFEEFPPIESGE